MKKIILLLLAASCFAGLAAQDYERPTYQELEAVFEDCNIRASEAITAGDYGLAVEILRECNKLFEWHQEQDPEHWDFRYFFGSNYYNLACYLSLESRTEEALAALDKAYDHGFYEYAWAMEDPDLENIRHDPRFAAIIEKMREKGDYMAILRECGPYRTENTSLYPEFGYEDPRNGRIRTVREYLKLDEVVGDGDEVSQIINLMTFVHNLIPHNGSHRAYCANTAIDLYNYSKANDGRGINCRQLAIVLNDCYHAMGFKSRFVTCHPQNPDDPDCHVINSVWSTQLGKWVWMDPSFNAYVTDENGLLLGIGEVRERMRDGRPYFLNEDANHNNETPQTKGYYLDYYMAKNLYWLRVPVKSYFALESPYFDNNWQYVGLVPEGYRNPYYTSDQFIMTSDADYFWQPPVFDKQ
ncbi:MAG: transglutaminase domain-containing protein [Alistipes sp.]|nr:transglutaminase domain-containing protein [Alistipes sp.]